MDTPDTPNNALTARQCLNCGTSFTPTRDWANFCKTKCRTDFHARHKAIGGVLISLVKAWTATRHAKPGSHEAEICAYARREITSIASLFNEEDKEAGRPGAASYVDRLMQSGTLYVDRRR